MNTAWNQHAEIRSSGDAVRVANGSHHAIKDYDVMGEGHSVALISRAGSFD